MACSEETWDNGSHKTPTLTDTVRQTREESTAEQHDRAGGGLKSDCGGKVEQLQT